MKNIDKIKILSNSTIKLIAISIMLFNHIGIIFFNKTPIFLKIGEIAFPLFAFCVAEGFYYTSNRKKYLRNLFIFALITEPIFDLAFFNRIFWFHQNVLFTLAFSVLFLMIYEHIKNNSKESNIVKGALIGFAFVLLLLISIIAFTDHCFYGITLVFIYYLFRDKPSIKFILAAILLLISFQYKFALISIPILLLYNGKKGLNMKYFFYSFYPGHLLILYILKLLIK